MLSFCLSQGVSDGEPRGTEMEAFIFILVVLVSVSFLMTRFRLRSSRGEPMKFKEEVFDGENRFIHALPLNMSTSSS